jgi:hypothetical protein
MQISAFDKKKLIPAAVVFLFFSAYIIGGYLLYKDYGVSTDEPVDYLRGQINYARFTGGSLDQFLKDCSMVDSTYVCYYPSLFSMLLYRFAPYGDPQPAVLHDPYWYGPSGNTQSIYLHRHQLTFAFFALSVFIFFLIGKKVFKDWKMGLLGALFLIISPRIFANSFYNPKDIPFLSAYVISIYTLLLFLGKKNILTAILHGIAVGVLCNIRTPGLIIIPVTFLFYFFDLILARASWKSYLRAGALLIAMGVVTAGLVYWFTPILYTDPIGNFIKIFNVMKQYPWNNYQLYMGQNITNKIPWHYALVWPAISTPIFYLGLFLFGFGVLVARTIQSRTRDHFRSLRDFYLAAVCGILPVAVVILMKSTLYNGNRQMYFVYPAWLLLALFGFKFLMDKVRRLTLHWRVWMAVILIAGLAYPVYFMIRYHPYQYVYFNFLAGRSMSDIKENYELDGWGVAVRDGLDFILKTDNSNRIIVKLSDGQPAGFYMLPLIDRGRLRFSGSPEYILTTYRYYPEQVIKSENVYYSIKVGDTAILTIYRVPGK